LIQGIIKRLSGFLHRAFGGEADKRIPAAEPGKIFRPIFKVKKSGAEAENTFSR